MLSVIHDVSGKLFATSEQAADRAGELGLDRVVLEVCRAHTLAYQIIFSSKFKLYRTSHTGAIVGYHI